MLKLLLHTPGFTSLNPPRSEAGRPQKSLNVICFLRKMFRQIGFSLEPWPSF